MQMAMVIVGGFVVAVAAGGRLTRWLARFRRRRAARWRSWPRSRCCRRCCRGDSRSSSPACSCARSSSASTSTIAPSAPPRTSGSAASGRSGSHRPRRCCRRRSRRSRPSLLPITGVIPLTQTIFLPQNMAMAAVLVIVSVTVAYVSAPREREARTAKMMGIEFRDDDRGAAHPPRAGRTIREQSRSSTSSSPC